MCCEVCMFDAADVSTSTWYYLQVVSKQSSDTLTYGLGRPSSTTQGLRKPDRPHVA